MSAVDTWMPLYIGDYLADTGHLSAAEHGAYLLLLMQQWRRGWLPDDDMQLARMVRMRVENWRRIAGNVRAFFDAGEMPGTLQQKRLHAEREKALGISAKRADAARAKAAAAADRSPERNNPSTPGSQVRNIYSGSANCSPSKPLETQETTSANAEQMQVVCTHNHNHSHLVSKKDTPPPPSASVPPKGGRTGERLPGDWRPDPVDAGFADKLGLDPERVADGFRDYWHSKPGAAGRKTDWSATWRNWCRRDAERVQQTRARQPESKAAWMFEPGTFDRMVGGSCS
jgi:uncharacterized protein YdaU (DUF1376 family)